jgi:hypothetical protein
LKSNTVKHEQFFPWDLSFLGNISVVFLRHPYNSCGL